MNPHTTNLRFKLRSSTASEKFAVLGSIALPFLLFAWWKFGNDADKHAAQKCITERKLFFQGIVSNYKTDVFAETSTFLLNDSAWITIPRSSKEVSLHDGDTVFKWRDTSVYVVKSNRFLKQPFDTFSFNCSINK